jgi:hypothetical protein
MIDQIIELLMFAFITYLYIRLNKAYNLLAEASVGVMHGNNSDLSIRILRFLK